MSTHSSTYLLQGTRVSINDLPKVSLHDHLDGGLRPQTIIELAGETGFALPADDSVALASWFAENANSGSLPRYIETFEKTVGVMQTASALRRVAREFVQDLSADGVVYAEVRWAPEQHLREGLSLDEAVAAVRKGFSDGTADVAAAGRVIKVSQILCALRHQPNSVQIAELALAHRDEGVVAFDIAGPELGFPPADHAEAFDLLAENFFPVTVHAGEADGLDSIRGALLDGRALRIGHGVRLAEDITLDPGDDEVVEFGTLATWILDRGIALELSPQSNLQTGAIAEWGSDLEDHPFDLLYQLGFPVTVNPDNRLMSNTSISKELYLLAEVFDYDLSDFELFQLNAAAAAFLPVEDREDLADQISAGFADAGS